MRKYMLLMFGAATCAAAEIVPCTSAIGQSVLAPGFACAQGAVTAGNFSASAPDAQLVLAGAATDPAGAAVLDFNPDLAVAPGAAQQTVTFLFQIDTATEAITTAVNGANGSVSGLVCGAAIVNGACPGGAVLSFTAAAGSSVGAAFAFADPIYVSERATAFSGPAGGRISLLTGRFAPPVAVIGAQSAAVAPEPGTGLPLAGGLALLATLALRRSRVHDSASGRMQGNEAADSLSGSGRNSAGARRPPGAVRATLG